MPGKILTVRIHGALRQEAGPILTLVAHRLVSTTRAALLLQMDDPTMIIHQITAGTAETAVGTKIGIGIMIGISVEDATTERSVRGRFPRILLAAPSEPMIINRPCLFAATWTAVS
jgi:hypothetical protein